MSDTLKSLKSELEDCSAVKESWIEDDNLHVVVTGQTYGKVSDILNEYKRNQGVSQIDHDDAVYSGEKRHYVLESE